MGSPKFLFVLTDGGRARFLERSPRDGHYTTVEEIDGRAQLQALRRELRANPPGRSISSSSPRRAAVGEEDFLRPAKEAFIGDVADRAAEACRRRKLDGVVIASPARLIGLLKARLEGRAAVVGAVGKDLTRTPVGELSAWLDEAVSTPRTSS